MSMDKSVIQKLVWILEEFLDFCFWYEGKKNSAFVLTELSLNDTIDWMLLILNILFSVTIF